MSGPVASFYADLNVNVSQSQIRKVDNFFDRIESKLKSFSKGFNLQPNIKLKLNSGEVSSLKQKIKAVTKDLSVDIPVSLKPKVNKKSFSSVLNRQSLKATSATLGVAVNKALGTLTPVINARVNSTILQASINTALRGLGSGFEISPKISKAAITSMRDELRVGLSNIFINPILSQSYLNQARQSQRPQRQPTERNQLADKSGRNFMYGGGTAGALARYGVGSVPFIGGAYGLMQLNTANQEAISTRLTTQAVLQSQGYTEQQGEQAFDWLRKLAKLNGFNYMQAAPDYNQFLSNALGAGMSLRGSQDIFKGFSEYQTAMGVTPARRKLVNNALSQMLGKGTINMEELEFRLAA